MKDTTALDCLLRTFADCEAVLLESVWAPPAAELRADGCEHGPSDGWSAKQKQWLSFTQLTPNPPHGCKAKVKPTEETRAGTAAGGASVPKGDGFSGLG